MRNIIFFTLIAICSTVNAEGFSAYGVDDLSCGKYIKDITSSSGKKNVYSWWVAGFVTGTNLEQNRALQTDNAGHEAWLKNYCEENPLATFMKAAIELNKELENRQW